MDSEGVHLVKRFERYFLKQRGIVNFRSTVHTRQFSLFLVVGWWGGGEFGDVTGMEDVTKSLLFWSLTSLWEWQPDNERGRAGAFFFRFVSSASKRRVPKRRAQSGILRS